MFFVGLAGSIIPYILFMGVMLVFTLGANAEVMKKLSPEKSEANVLEVDITVSASSTDPVNFNFSAYYNCPSKFSTEQTEDLSSDQPGCLTTPPKKASSALFSNIQAHYRQNFCGWHFGLSPPLMV